MIGNDANLVYQLELRAEELCRLCVIWRRNIRPLPGDDHGDAWGPSDKDLQDALVFEFNPHLTESEELDRDDSGESDDGDWEDQDDVIDSELVESMEAVAFADEYRSGDEHFLYFDSDMEHVYTHATPDGSPRKRNREF